MQNSSAVDEQPSEGISYDLLTAVFFLVAGPSIGFTLTTLTRSAIYMKASILGHKDDTAKRDEEIWLHKYKKLRLLCTDNERNELDEALAFNDFPKATSLGLMLVGLWYPIDNHILTQNYSLNMNDLVAAVPIIASLILFVGSHYQKTKNLDPLLNVLRRKYHL